MNVFFEENFVLELDQNWIWVHENPEAWKLEDGVLYLRVLPGTLWGDANNAFNFLLYPVSVSIDGLAIRVTVANQPRLMGEQAGLIWYHDDDNYIKLVKESLDGEEWIVLAREEGGKPELINKTTISSESAELQLVLAEGRVRGQFRVSPDDLWHPVGECDLLEAANPKVGLFTHGGSEEIERWAVFRNFSMRK